MNNFDRKIIFLEESLKDWFKTHRDKRTGKKFKGWVNCRTGGPCSSKSKSGKYPACRPTHAQCKTIKGKLHKKKGPGRVQWKENLTENYFPVKTSFADLPDAAPYGFWVWEKKYVIARYMDDHIKILREIMPEHARLGDMSLITKAYNLGLVRMAKEDRLYYLTHTKGNKTSLNTAKDIAKFYNKDVYDDMNPPDTGNKLKSSPDDAL